MYVITGATGNTGSVVADTLLANGKPIRVIGRSPERLQEFANRGAEVAVGNLTDAGTLTSAFQGADAVFAMIPPNLTTQNYRAYQDRIADALAVALAQSNVRHAVTLSSVGADKPAGTGPVAGLHRLEQTINGIAGLNVLHLRAGYFMENTLAQLGVIQATGMAGGPVRPDLQLPMIATRDIGAAAAEALLRLDFRGQQTRELLGQRDLSMTEATTILGSGIGKPGLRYVQLPDEQVQAAMMQMGISENFVSLLLEMSRALNSGHMRALEQRSARNTTPTSYETFVAQEIVPRYQGRSAAG